MKISNLKIRNYRSARDLTIECMSQVVMLGPNNHGKSNILHAIEFALSTSAKATEKDFFDKRENGDNSLWVEVTFNDLTEQEQTTFRKYVSSDNTACIRKTATINERGIIEISYNGYLEEPTEAWLKSDADLRKRELIAETPLKDYVPDKGAITKVIVEEAQRNYINEHRGKLKFEKYLETGPFLGQKNIGGGVLPAFYLIPAVRDLTDETKIKAGTTLGKLMNNAIQEMATRDPRFKHVLDKMGEIIATFNSSDAVGSRPKQLIELEENLEAELSHWGVSVQIEIEPPEIEKIFELGTNLYLDDGIKTLADQKGHGLQRAVIFALVKAWAKALRSSKEADNEIVSRAASNSVIFAMEEPELFLHPHAQRRMAADLRDLSEIPQHQVFLCTHSTHFVDMERYKNICMVRMDSRETGSSVRQCTRELFHNEPDKRKRFHMARWINPDRGEMFFAKKVAFVEGETEAVIFPLLAHKLGCFDSEISVVDCASKFNLPLYITIAKAFELPYIVVHDEDPMPDTTSVEWESLDEDKKRSKRITFELNSKIRGEIDSTLGKIEICSPDFERVAGVSKSQTDKKGKALAAVDHFDSKSIDEIPARLDQVVRAVYKKP